MRLNVHRVGHTFAAVSLSEAGADIRPVHSGVGSGRSYVSLT